MALGYDYSSWRPKSKADLDGIDFCCRYGSYTPWKNLTYAEAAQLSSWGKLILSNWETDGQGGDYSTGRSDALAAVALFSSCGMPAGYPIYFSIDEDVEPSTQVGYFQGVGSVLPMAQIGVYGSAAMVEYMVSNLYANYGWRTMSTSWSGGASTVDSALVQTNVGLGGNVDTDSTVINNFGGWNFSTLPSTPTAASTKGLVAVSIVKDNDVNTSSDAQGWAGLSWAQGTRHVVQVVWDGASNLNLRVVLQLTTGPLVVEESWQPADGRGVLELPAGSVGNACGVILEPVGAQANYYVTAV